MAVLFDGISVDEEIRAVLLGEQNSVYPWYELMVARKKSASRKKSKAFQKSCRSHRVMLPNVSGKQ